MAPLDLMAPPDRTAPTERTALPERMGLLRATTGHLQEVVHLQEVAHLLKWADHRRGASGCIRCSRRNFAIRAASSMISTLTPKIVSRPWILLAARLPLRFRLSPTAPCTCHAVLIQNSKLMVTNPMLLLARLTPCCCFLSQPDTRTPTHTQSMTHTHTHTQLYLSDYLRQIRNKSERMTSIIARVCSQIRSRTEYVLKRNMFSNSITARVCSQTRKLSLCLFKCHREAIQIVTTR